MIECIIFDCDGTLVDSEYLCNLGLEIKLKEYGLSISAYEMMDRFRGRKLSEILKEIENLHEVNLSADFVSSYRSLVEELFEEQLQPCEGVAEMLKEVSIPRCVASSGPLKKINQALRVTGLSGYFSGNIFSSYEIGSWKPSPDIFLHAARSMGFPPAKCAVVEDSHVGITAAKSAGMVPILYDPSAAYLSVDGVRTIQHMSELQRVVT